MTKPGLILPLLWFCCSFAFGNGIFIEQVGKVKNMCDPGGVATVVLRIENQTSHEVKAKPTWSLPAGWSTLSDDMTFNLPAGQSILKLFSIRVNAGAVAGEFPLAYKISDLLRPGISGEIRLFFEVKEVTDIQLTPADAPGSVVAGKDVHASFILQNLGNTEQRVVVSSQNCTLEEKGPFHLAPFESKVLRAKAKTLAVLEREGRIFMNLSASLQNNPTIETAASQVVRVLPQVERQKADGHQIPAYFRLSHITRQWRDGARTNGFQGEFYANGTLDKAGENQIEVRLRGPDQFGMLALGQYDEYYATFENSTYYAHLGDKTFTLTPLTEYARYGRGVETSVKTEGYEFGAFHHRPRFFPDIVEETAGYLRYQSSEGQQFSLNALQKKFAGDRGDAVLMSAHATLRPWKHTTFEGEIARGAQQMNWGNGIFMRVNSQPVRRVRVATNLIYADKYFPGYFTNTLSFYGQTDYQASSKLAFSFFINQDANNASQDTLFAISPWSRSAQLGLSYNFGKKLVMRCFLRQNEMKDRMPSLKFHFKEETVRLQLVKNLEKFQLSIIGEAGNRENLLNLPEDRFSRTYHAILDIRHQIGQRLSVVGNAQHHWFADYSGKERKQWIFGGAVHSQLSPYNRLRLAFQTNYLLEEYYRNRNLLDLNFSQKLGKMRNHELSVAANYVLLQRTQQNKDLSLQVNYTYHFGVRTTGKIIQQGLKGQITQAGATSVSGVVLTLNGQSVKTAPDGSFSFENIPPGKHYLMLDPTSVQLHDVPDVAMPIEVTVGPGNDAWVSFGLTNSVAVKGQVAIEPEKNPIQTAGNQEVRPIFIFEMTNGVETFRRLSGENGHFEFPDLRPGKWVLRILNGGSLNGFYFERTEWELDLPPGSATDLNMELLRKKREVKFQDKLPGNSTGK